MELYKHQHKFKKGYSDKGFLVHEGGTGKSVCAALWLKDGRDSDALVVCPKKIVRKWQILLEEWGTKATVISKETFKKDSMYYTKEWSAKVIDEADEFASPLFIAKKRSQLSSSMYELTRLFPKMPTLLLTATPIRSNPWNLHTLLVYYGVYIDWKVWRDRFFTLEERPYLKSKNGFKVPAYMNAPDWRILIRQTLEKYADIVLLSECVDDLPPESFFNIDVKTPVYERQPEDKVFYTEHRHEQQNKAEHILEIGKEFRKVIVVAFYREQIEELKEKLSKDRPTFVIYGDVKDQESEIEKAQQADECFFIVQSSIGAGFDADMFSCIIFASMSYAVRDYMQMKWRVKRIKNLHPVFYYHLLGGRCDKAILKNIEEGKDFVPSEYMKNMLPFN